MIMMIIIIIIRIIINNHVNNNKREGRKEAEVEGQGGEGTYEHLNGVGCREARDWGK